MSERDYYCQNKFIYLKIDLELRTTYNCHAARPHRIDLDWLDKNPGELFNNPTSVKEREMMLNNQRNSSCEQNCWKAEDQNLPSPRLVSKGQFRNYTEIYTRPRTVDIAINTDCNLTCSYCTKEYSTSWRNDVMKNGDYNIASEPDRYRINSMDQVLSKLSQSERLNADSTRKVLDEIARLSKTAGSKIIITGGEPFLSQHLMELVKNNTEIPVKIFTGLGVNFKRFERIVRELQAEHKNAYLAISADSARKNYEFNRYGMKWDDFLKKMEFLKSIQMPLEFSSVISNLTVNSFPDLYNMFSSDIFKIEMVYNPGFMSPYVLDPRTKEDTLNRLENLNFHKKQFIIDGLQAEPTEQQRRETAQFLREFVRRRPDLDLSIFPETFLKWIEHVV